ncbi:MAG: GntR family transcriptional regulator [Solirubrobacteraceae bacterium]
MSDLSPTENTALVEDLADRLQAAILAGEYPIGSWLRQEALAERFGVSRTPVREALRVLQAAGVVSAVPRRGALVRGPTTTEIREAYDIRAELEGFGAQLAATHARESDLAALKRASAIFASVAESLLKSPATNRKAQQHEWARANNLFHDGVLVAAGNQRLRRVVGELHRAFPRNLTWSALADEPTLITDNVNEHERVRAAIERGDAPAARRWMSDHVRRAGELVADWFEQVAQVGLEQEISEASIISTFEARPGTHPEPSRRHLPIG